MKTAKLVTGIITIVLSVIVLFQSCAAGVYNTLGSTGEISGTAGFIVALLMIAGGVIAITTRSSGKKGGSISAMIVYFLASLIGFTNAGSYQDLKIWSALCLILGSIHLISIIKIVLPDE